MLNFETSSTSRSLHNEHENVICKEIIHRKKVINNSWSKYETRQLEF